MVRDGLGFPLLISEQSLCSPLWFLLPWAFLKLGSKVHLTTNPSSVNDFEGLSGKSTGPISKVILQGVHKFLIIHILKSKKGTTKKIFSGMISNHKLYAGYPALQCLTQSFFIGNCSNMAKQTDGPSSQITFFLCLPITAREWDQRFVVEVLDAVGKTGRWALVFYPIFNSLREILTKQPLEMNRNLQG